ncbi:hypothetical protein HNP49_002211 [Pseudomonas fluvialis]|uniref:TIR domain-containing protein n=1 Tax=Pseudomonas fluvialis TaxID=1793966 RepID=A0A7X0BT08_9PSED|nr:toll/interleukin-1 receptor domain-containing protein [Pseudomonas fluvialis]MBB6342043.1 hypothetical protein [Pseudomonas fluvialis]
MSQPLKAFISYSHADEHHKNRLLQFLSILKRDGTLESWHDRLLVAGDKLDEEIEENLNSADLVVLLVSQDFISSYYCYEVELKKALSQVDRKESRIISIIVDHCTWRDTPLSDFVLMPRDAKPVTEYENSNKAWLEISEEIRRVCSVVKKKEIAHPEEVQVVENGDLNKDFQEYLAANEMILHHKAKDEVSLDDIYILPDLRTLDEEPGKFDSIVSSLKIESPGSCPRKTVIVGEEQSGKTALCKRLFKTHYDKGQVPVIIRGDEIKSADIQQLINSARAKAYAGAVPPSKTIIIEEVEAAKLNAKYLSSLIQGLLSRSEHVIFISGKVLRFNEMTWKEFSETSKYEILPFGHVLRGELINKWNSLGQEETIDLAELHAENDKVTHHIDSLLRKNIVPPKPVFILMILQTLESSSPSDYSLTAYGHCYNTLIQQSLKKSKIKSDQIDKYVNYLTELAHFIFATGRSRVTEEEVAQFKSYYSSRYLIDSHEKVIADLCSSGLLRRDLDSLSFSYKYIFYFYAAKYIAENQQGKNLSDIDSLCSKMHMEKHANILIFVTYHTRDQEILDRIVSFAQSIFPEETPATLESSDTEHFEDILKTVPALAMELRTAQDIEAERKSSLDRKDSLEGRVTAIESDDDDEMIETHTFADINRSAKAVEIIGQILRNRHGSLRLDQLASLTSTAFNTGLRFLSFYFKITKSLRSEIVDEITRVIRSQESLTDTEVTDLARKLFFQFCYSMSFSVIRKISFSTGSDHLIQIFKQIAEETNTPAGYLISLCIQLEFTKKINKDYLLEVKRNMDRSSISYRLMQEIVIQHLYLHNVDYADRQWLSAKLDIPMKEQRILQNQKQTKILN